MKNPTITVIVPICNVDAYLPKCIESIIQQTYTELEIILIDDGSQDMCPQICDDYANKDERIQVIHQKNEGLSSARNAGLDIATGEYVSFIDSDDWLEVDMYEQMLNAAEETEADLVTCDAYFWKYGTQKCRTESRQTSERILIDNNEELFRHILSPRPTVRFEVWNKLFRRTIIGDTRFKVGQRYEDIFFDRIVFGRVKRCVSIDRSLYNHLVARPGSTISTFNLGCLDKLNEIDEFISYLAKRKRPDIVELFVHYAVSDSVFFYGQARKYHYDDDVKRMIYRRFLSYYKNDSKKPLKHIIFRINPELYFRLVIIKERLKDCAIIQKLNG